MSDVTLSESLQNTMRRPSIPFKAMGGRATRQNPQILQGCPCCGAEISAERPRVDEASRSFIYKNSSIALDASKYAIMEILSRRFPGIVSHDTLTMHLWPRDEPEDPAKNIQVHICWLRRSLSRMGLGILNVYTTGYRLVSL